MKKSKYSSKKVRREIKETESSLSVDHISQELGMDKSTVFTWLSYSVDHINDSDRITIRYLLCRSGHNVSGDAFP